MCSSWALPSLTPHFLPLVLSHLDDPCDVWSVSATCAAWQTHVSALAHSDAKLRRKVHEGGVIRKWLRPGYAHRVRDVTCHLEQRADSAWQQIRHVSIADGFLVCALCVQDKFRSADGSLAEAEHFLLALDADTGEPVDAVRLRGPVAKLTFAEGLVVAEIGVSEYKRGVDVVFTDSWERFELDDISGQVLAAEAREDKILVLSRESRDSYSVLQCDLETPEWTQIATFACDILCNDSGTSLEAKLKSRHALLWSMHSKIMSVYDHCDKKHLWSSKKETYGYFHIDPACISDGFLVLREQDCEDATAAPPAFVVHSLLDGAVLARLDLPHGGLVARIRAAASSRWFVTSHLTSATERQVLRVLDATTGAERTADLGCSVVVNTLIVVLDRVLVMACYDKKECETSPKGHLVAVDLLAFMRKAADVTLVPVLSELSLKKQNDVAVDAISIAGDSYVLYLDSTEHVNNLRVVSFR